MDHPRRAATAWGDAMLRVAPMESLDVNEDYLTMRCQRGHNIKAAMSTEAGEVLMMLDHQAPSTYEAKLQFLDAQKEWRDVPQK
eukprot:6010566-Pleurochrysis_carterae.AAC.1